MEAAIEAAESEDSVVEFFGQVNHHQCENKGKTVCSR